MTTGLLEAQFDPVSTAQPLRYDSGNTILAQSIYSRWPCTIHTIELSLKKIGNPSGNLYCEIHDSRDGTSLTVGASTGLVGDSSAAVSTGSVTSSYSTLTFTLGTPATLTANTTYYIVLYGTYTVSTSNYVAWGVRFLSDYSVGIMWTIHDDLSWHSGTLFDYTFRTKGTYNFDETVSASDTVTETITYLDTFTETVSVSDAVRTSQSIQTNYAYYLLSDDGKVYEYSSAYKGDAGSAITAQLITKNTDLTDQAGTPSDLFKIVYNVKLFYLDVDSSTNVTLYISIDDGTTWETTTTGTKSLGTGSGQVKTATWHFAGGKMGQFFKFKIESGSATTRIQWLGLEIEYEECGPHFNVT